MNPSRTAHQVTKSSIHNPQALAEAYHYANPVPFSRGMRVELDNSVMLLISGTASVDENGRSIHVGDFAAQVRRTFANIAALLASEGADWHDVARTTCYLVDFRYYDDFNRVRAEFYRASGLNPYPASTCVQAGLCRPELLVEIEAIAILPKTRTSSSGQ